jgi:hypothetical protein
MVRSLKFRIRYRRDAYRSNFLLSTASYQVTGKVPMQSFLVPWRWRVSGSVYIPLTQERRPLTCLLSWTMSSVRFKVPALYAREPDSSQLYKTFADVDLFASSEDVSQEDILHHQFVPGFVFGYSQDLPFLATGEKMLASKWNNKNLYKKNLLDWYSAPEPLSSSEMRFIIPSDPTELIRSDFRALFEVSDGILLAFSSAFVKTRYAHPYFHYCVLNL